ncbi:MAG: hypothetical protein ABIH49_00350 [archaeon]
MKIITMVLIGILVLLAYNAFSDKIPLTGDFISGKNETATISINAGLTIPEITLKGNFNEVKLVAYSDSNFIVGSEKNYLGNSNNNYIIMKNFRGEISLNSDEIKRLKGESSEIIFNGYPANLAGNSAKVSFEKSAGYNVIEIDNVEIDKLSYVTSGHINIADMKNTFKVDNEKVEINGYNGSLVIEEELMQLNGNVVDFEINGNYKIQVE